MPEVRFGDVTMNLESAARQLADRLAATETHIVFAESCTGGLASASLANVPGISAWLCGSAVTYREHTKTEWLAVSSADIARRSAVSPEVAEQMALGVLEMTSEADVALSITGHLGPDAPAGFDGKVFVATAYRRQDALECQRIILRMLTSQGRSDRQREAAALLLRTAIEALAAGRHAGDGSGS